MVGEQLDVAIGQGDTVRVDLLDAVEAELRDGEVFLRAVAVVLVTVAIVVVATVAAVPANNFHEPAALAHADGERGAARGLQSREEVSRRPNGSKSSRGLLLLLLLLHPQARSGRREEHGGGRERSRQHLHG